MSEELRICWHGHACIEIIYRGERLMIDPHDGASIGICMPKPPANPHYILVTHQHFDHNAVDVVRGGETREVVIEKTGEFTLGAFRVSGVKLPHDEYGGRYRGHVVAYKVEAGDVSILHLSDVGDIPPEDVVEKLRSDIVVVPAGNVYTLDAEGVKKLIEMLDPHLVIPVHYWLPGYFLPLDPLDNLLNLLRKRSGWKGKVEELQENCFDVNVERLRSGRFVYVLKPPVKCHGGRVQGGS